MIHCVLTTGVYGFTEDSYFRTLVDAGVDSFCDIRIRRGMRGSTYAFVNAKRLEDRVRERGRQVPSPLAGEG